MKIELEKVIGASVIIGGIIFGYGQLSSKVDSLKEYNDTEIRKLADDNMNAIIVLNTKMDMLVTKDMKIVPSQQVGLNKAAIKNLQTKPFKIPKDFRKTVKELEEDMDELFMIVDKLKGKDDR